MNTPLENVIIDLTTLLEHQKFEYRHGFKSDFNYTIKVAILACERRLQEEAEIIMEAYNVGGGPGSGRDYYEHLFRSGEDAKKALHGHKFEARKEGEI